MVHGLSSVWIGSRTNDGRQRRSATYTPRARMPGDQRSRAQSRRKRGRTEAELSKVAAGGRCGSSSAAVSRSGEELCPAQKRVSRIVSRDGAWAGWKGTGCGSESSQQRAEHPECEEHVHTGEQDGAHPANSVLEGRRTATVSRAIIQTRIIFISVVRWRNIAWDFGTATDSWQISLFWGFGQRRTRQTARGRGRHLPRLTRSSAHASGGKWF